MNDIVERLEVRRAFEATLIEYWTSSAKAEQEALVKLLEDATAEIQRLRGEVGEARNVCGEAYQVVGCLLSDTGKFDTQHGEKVLDNLSQARMVHDDVLPWASVETQPVAAKGEESRLGQRADPPFLVQPRDCKYTPEEVGRMLGNRVVQPHYAAWLVRKAIAHATPPSAPAVVEVPEGWAFNSADFSMIAAGRIGGYGFVELIRDVAGRKWWHSLDDEGKEREELNVYGRGATFAEAMAAASQKASALSKPGAG